jgi:hypothetical protein
VLKSLLRRMRNRVSATPASLDRFQVAVTAPRCSGSVSWAALPDVAYKGITFTMPDVLWPIFHDNPHLAAALSASAAKILRTRASVRFGLRVGVMAILHTFNGMLEFNSHVHTMVTAGGLYVLSDSWIHGSEGRSRSGIGANPKRGRAERVGRARCGD